MIFAYSRTIPAAELEGCAMDRPNIYEPDALFDAPDRVGEVPRVFVSPQRYVQGEGVLGDVGRYVKKLIDPGHVVMLMSARRASTEGLVLGDSLARTGIASTVAVFDGECSFGEIGRHAAAANSVGADAVVAVGGGKCVDTGKAVADRLGVPVVVIPTLASNDAPCSALSVIYSPAGEVADVEFYPSNPALVVVDTAIVAAAPERYLVAGMGDAMATWYEARVAIENPTGRNALGARPTLAAASIGEVCAATLFDHGVSAAESVRVGRVDDSVERVVEANTLLSGIGFESGGLAAAHGVATAFTHLPHVHDRHLHGEMVAFGVLTQLELQGDRAEAERVASFFVDVGLPVTLGHLGVGRQDDSSLDTLVAATLEFRGIGNLGFPVSGSDVRTAMLLADELGSSLTGLARRARSPTTDSMPSKPGCRLNPVASNA